MHSTQRGKPPRNPATENPLRALSNEDACSRGRLPGWRGARLRKRSTSGCPLRLNGLAHLDRSNTRRRAGRRPCRTEGPVAGVNQPADGEDALIVPENVNDISVTGANPVKNSTTWGSKAHVVNCAELPLGQGLESIVGLDSFHTSVAAIEELGD